MENLLALAIVLLAGLITARLIGLLKLPDVTAYLIAGFLIGPSLFHFISKGQVETLEVISQTALAMIAFVTGVQLRFSEIRKSGSQIMNITLFEVLGAFITVFLAMILIFKQSVAFSLTLSAIATATAPAATIMVINQYHARGPLVDTLIPVVAIDDGYCIMAFGICSTIAASLMSGADLSIMTMVVKPILQIAGALLLGIAAGVLTVRLLDYFRNDGELTSYVLAVIFALTYLAGKWGLSSLLVMMAMGSTITNLSGQYMRVLNSVDKLTAPLFMAFFVLSGASFDLSILKDVGWIGIGYILFRSLGKFFGTYFSAKAVKMPDQVSRYMGYALLPQAGVAIGLALIATEIIPPPYGEMIQTITLAATIVYEILGPVLTKWALGKAGEIPSEAPAAS